MNVWDMLRAPWAIQPEILTEMCAVYASHREGESIDIKTIEAATGRTMNNEPKNYTVQDGVAIIPVEGVLSKRMSLLQQICGGQSYQSLQQDLATALNDPNVSSIILSIDSPGGAVDGVQGAADAIYQARAQKPIASFVDGKAASAAYWLGSSASQMYIGSDTDQVGSIGVITQHIDTSNAEHQRGVKITDIASGKYKATGSQHAPLSAQDRNAIQDHLDQIYGTFVDTVARNRGIDADTVQSKMADGRVFVGKRAIEAGLVDGQMTLPQLIDKMKSQAGGASSGVFHPKQPIKKGNQPMAEQETMYTSAQLQTAKDEAKKAGFDEGFAQGRVEGATAERDRIQAVEKVALPGHDALIAQLKFDGKTSGPEAAAQVVVAENELRGKELAKMRNDAAQAVAQSAGTTEADAEAKNAPAAKAEIDPKAVAEQARGLVAAAKKDGKILSYATAVMKITTAK